MSHRAASLLSSLAVAVLALTTTAFVWSASPTPTRALGAPSCCFAPAPHSPSACECLA